MKPPSIPHVKYVTRRGKLYAYFNTGQKKDGKPIYHPMPHPAHPGFYDSLAALNAGRTKRENRAYTVEEMIEDYRKSPDWERLALGSQKFYEAAFRRIREAFGDWPVNDVEAEYVEKEMDSLSGDGARNAFFSVLGILYSWGRRRRKTANEPTKDIKKIPGGQHEPWPEEVLEAALACDSPRVRLAVHLLYFTGQRIGDVCAMRWNDIKPDGRIHVRQQKRGKLVKVPLMSELEAELARLPKRGITILTNWRGQPVGDQTIRKELQAFTRKMGIETVPHGLRKNAVNTFLEAGCSVAEVASITGQSYRVVERYAARVNNDHLSEAAILKFENKRGTGNRTGNSVRKPQKTVGGQ